MFPCVLSVELPPVLGFCPTTPALKPEEEAVLIWLIPGAEAADEPDGAEEPAEELLAPGFVEPL
jgi:hypothetical protein